MFSAFATGSAATSSHERPVWESQGQPGCCTYAPGPFRPLVPPRPRPTAGGGFRPSGLHGCSPRGQPQRLRFASPPVQILHRAGVPCRRTLRLTRLVAPRRTSGSWAQDAVPLQRDTATLDRPRAEAGKSGPETHKPGNLQGLQRRDRRMGGRRTRVRLARSPFARQGFVTKPFAVCDNIGWSGLCVPATDRL